MSSQDVPAVARDPVSAARLRSVQTLATLVIVATLWIAALAAMDAFDPHGQYLSLFRAAPETVSAPFSLCDSAQPGDNCVISGGAFRYRGQRIAVAGVDAPRRFRARCESEAALGETSARKLQDLLNQAPFEILHIGVRPANRRLAALRRDGGYFADQLIEAGLARRRILFSRNWCG